MKLFRKRLFSSLLLVCILLFNTFMCSSCFREKRIEYEFWQDKSEITRIEIVEAYHTYDYEMNAEHWYDALIPYQRVLYTIEDIDAFLEILEGMEYLRFNPLHLTHMGCGELAIKISYNDGDYELIGQETEAVVDDRNMYFYSESDGHFIYNDFYDLLLSYLNTAESQQFQIYRDVSDIYSIEIFNSTDIGEVGYNEYDHMKFKISGYDPKRTWEAWHYGTVEIVAKVDNIELFLSKLTALEYSYDSVSLKSETQYNIGWNFNNQGIKITYNDGDYEMLSHNYRAIFTVRKGERNINLAYMGTFDEESFYSFLSEYCK